MATPAVQPRLVRTELVVMKQDGKNQPNTMRLFGKPITQVNNCNMASMTEAEAEVFFAICENPSSEPIEMFANFSKVAQWFNE